MYAPVKVSAETSTFKFQYVDVPRQPHPYETESYDLLDGRNRVTSVEEDLQRFMSTGYSKVALRSWESSNRKFNYHQMKKVNKFKLKALVSDEDIQRYSDDKHIANDILNADLNDARLMDIPDYAKDPNTGEMKGINGRHTVTALAWLAYNGKIPGYDHTNWQEFEINCAYVETDNLAFARAAFAVKNGKGTKKQSEYDKLRLVCRTVLVDKDTFYIDQKDINDVEKVRIGKQNNVYFVDKDNNPGYASTVSNISQALSCTNEVWEFITTWWNTYFHYEPMHVGIIFFWRDYFSQTGGPSNVTQSFAHDIAAMIQSLFGSSDGFASAQKAAWKNYELKTLGSQKSRNNDDAYMWYLCQLYRAAGGQESLPVSINLHKDLYKSSTLDIIRKIGA